MTIAHRSLGAEFIAFQLFPLLDGYLESFESVSGGAHIKACGYLLRSRVARFEVDDMVNLPGSLLPPNLAKGLMGFQLPSEFQSLAASLAST